MDHDAEFHERRIHSAASSIDNIDVEFSHRFRDCDIGLPNATLCYFCFGKWNTNAVEYQLKGSTTQKARLPSCNNVGKFRVTGS